MLTYNTEGTRSAILTIARGLGIDNDISAYISSLVVADRGATRTLNQMYYGDEDNKPIYEFVNAINEYPELLEGAMKVEGLCNGSGSHAGGIIFVDEPFTKTTALMKTNSGDVITQFDLHECEKVGLIKIDLLSIEGLDKIRACLDLLIKDGRVEWKGSLKATYESVIGINNLERNAPEMWKLLHEHKVLSLFQMEKDSGIQALGLIKPDNIDQLATLNSVIRLMPQDKDSERPLVKYARFRNNISEWYKEMDEAGLKKEEQKLLESILGSSSGMCIYQEQIMQLVMLPEVGGFSLAWADKLRKAVAKKIAKDFAALESEFLRNAEEKGLSKNLIRYVWYTLIYTQRGYSFNCVSKDTILYIGSTDRHKPLTVEEMYKIKNDKGYANQTGHKYLCKKYRTFGYGTALSLFDDGRIHDNAIVDIVPGGQKQTYVLTTKSGRSITCTAKHKFPTPEGEKKLKDLAVGDCLYCIGRYEKGASTYLDEIASIEKAGIEDVYDIEVADPAHNFVLDNGLVTSNSAHCLSYSLIALQELNLCYKYPIIYWDTANLIVDSGSLDGADKGTNYGKMAVAIANIQKNKVNIERPLINSAERGFIPDADKDEILFALKAINGVGDSIVDTILSLRPFVSLDDFVEKTKITAAPMVALIKAGCFKELYSEDRKETLKYYLEKYVFSKNTSLTCANLKKIDSMGLIPEELKLAYSIYCYKNYVLDERFVYQVVIDETKRVPQCGYHDRLFKLDNRAQKFFKEQFSEDSVVRLAGDSYVISEKKFNKEWKEKTSVITDWLKQEDTIKAYNDAQFMTLWDGYGGNNSDSAWDMAALSYYYGEHELKDIDNETYGVVNYFDLPERPQVYDCYYKYINGSRVEVPKFKIVRIAGTVLQADNNHHTVSLLTVNGVVNVKFNKGQYAFYNKTISAQLDPTKDKKTVLDKSWFQRGNLLMICGYRQDDNFRAYRYNDTVYTHTVAKINKIQPGAPYSELDISTERRQV